MTATRQAVFVLAPGLHLLDLAGPAQVFASANQQGAHYGLSYVGAGANVDTAQGVSLAVGTDWPQLTAADTVIVPGWAAGGGPPANRVPESLLDRVSDHAQRGGRVASVCSGAFALAAAGLLDGRRATTHHELQDALAHSYPAVRVVRDVLFVSDEHLHTSAGIASGIDLALHLVTADHGPASAARTARSMVVPIRRTGDAPQDGGMLRHRAHLSDLVHRAQDRIDASFTEPLPLGGLAADLAVSERTLTRAFVAQTGLTPHAYQRTLRLELAEQLVAQGFSREETARRVGFTDARMLRRLLSAS